MERLFIVFFGLVLLVLELTVGEGFIVQLVLALVSLVIISVYWIITCIRKQGRLPGYDWNFVGLGLAVTCMACALFATQMQWHTSYWAVHSIWHVLGALGQFFLLYIRPPMPKFAFADAPLLPLPSADLLLLQQQQQAKKKISHITPDSIY